MIVAGIDCGTNSIRLLIAEKQGTSLKDIVRIMRIVRLGQDIDKTGYFAEEALQRTFESCEEFAQICKQHNVEKIRFVATSATRDAKNREVFLQGVKRILGAEVEVISGDEEASLSFAGALNVLSAEQKQEKSGTLETGFLTERTCQNSSNILVVDIGGGSTEFVCGHKTPDKTISLDMGCVRMTERFLKDGVNSQSIAKAIKVIDEYIAKADEKIDFTRISKFIGLAGSITTITANYLKLDKYDSEKIHATNMSFKDAINSCNELLYSTHKERASMSFLHPKRADVIMGGALVFRQILIYFEEMRKARKTTLSHVITSENDILDGIALSIE
ncbi:Ppx/GppA family phosphatase [Actinomyces sp. zg-332]|uniref:Ppx/GppA phosphatase family protein n=1 Tax=Actinomyces sp. zg-332 TaxID=2708340 RepID=UPI00141F7D78|nr:Ppx/GppA phosphatase family protein [Actinomyces sp. zg-332]QPK94303.1 Ppx/GppA family phosphatase [Actinomyces sp. zg-332]